MHYDWPGNVRELENAMERGLKEAKKQLLLKACNEAKGNLNEAAKILGVNITYLYRLIRNLNLKNILKS